MNNIFEEQIKAMTDPELKEIVIHRHHNVAYITAAKKELFKRGVELFDIGQSEPSKFSAKSNVSWNWFLPKWSQNIVNDANAPQLFSRLAINIFSVLFSVIFGAVLLSINLKALNKQKKIIPVILFSLGYTILSTILVGLLWTKFEMNISIFIVLLNSIGAAFLYNSFWANYIGIDFQYRTRSFVIPMAAGLIMIAVLFLFLMKGI